MRGQRRDNLEIDSVGNREVNRLARVVSAELDRAARTVVGGPVGDRLDIHPVTRPTDHLGQEIRSLITGFGRVPQRGSADPFTARYRSSSSIELRPTIERK